MNLLNGRPIPIFPLPNVVLYPRVILPLYIFEPRYREMLTDAIDSHGKIAMALLKPGWEPEYHGEPEVHAVVGVGSVVTYRTRDDGTSDVVLVGDCRARIVDWVRGKIYRRARLHRMIERAPVSMAHREQLCVTVREWYRALARPEDDAGGVGKLQKLYSDEEDPGFLIDFLASRVLDEPREKQALLQELEVERRARGLHRLLARRGLA